MKKQKLNKKLSVNKVEVTRLSNNNLSGIAGGATIYSKCPCIDPLPDPYSIICTGEYCPTGESCI